MNLSCFFIGSRDRPPLHSRLGEFIGEQGEVCASLVQPDVSSRDEISTSGGRAETSSSVHR
jgi:hypothetical protein